MRWVLVSLLTAAPALLGALAPDQEISQYIHETWLDKHGLPVNTVLSIAQTPDGYLWLATEEGLVRFDGIRFTTYTEQNTPAIPSRHILRLFVDRRGRLWIGTYNGLSRWEAGRFSRPGGETLRKRSVFGFAEPTDGVVWVATAHGLFSFSDDTVTRYGTDDGFPDDDFRDLLSDRSGALSVISGRAHLCRFTPGTRPACSSYGEILRSLFIDSRGRLWIGTYTRMIRRSEDGHLEQEYLAAGSPLLADTIFEDRSGNLWFGSREYEMVKITSTGVRFQNDPATNRLGPVMAFFEDRERNLWVGTAGNGLHRFSDNKITLYTTRNGLDADIILPVTTGRGGDIFFATYQGTVGVVREDRLTILHHLRAATGRAMVLGILESHDGTLWIATQGQGLFRKEPGKTIQRGDLPIPADTVPVVYEDRSGALWIIVRGGGALRWKGGRFDHFTDEDGLPDNFLRLIRESADGDLWFASATGGISVYRNGRFIPGDQIFNQPLPTKAIQTIHIDSFGLVWISTNGNGLFIWDGEMLTPVRFHENALSSLVLSIVEDDTRNLWMGTNRGILRVERSETTLYLKGAVPSLAPLVLTTAHGLRSAECVGGTQQSAARGSDGKLYFATVGGLAVIDPKNLPANTVAPPVHIEEITVNGALVAPGETVSATGGIERLEIRYTALSFINPAYIIFKYRLDGFDHEWVAAGTQRSAFYTNLPPGNYTFSVIAANSDGLWNQQGASLSLTVIPRFYQTSFFRVLIVILIALFVYVVSLLRVRAIRAQNLRLSRMVDAKTHELTVANEMLREMSLIDPLTGLRNRRYFSEILKSEAASYLRARSHAVSGYDLRRLDREKIWGIFLLDLDHFKQVNDRFGHDSGDLILTQIATLFKNAVRADDVVIRWGGEEFLIVLRNSVPEYLPAFAAKIRSLLRNALLKTTHGEFIRKTVSVGFSRLPFYLDTPERLNIEQTISIADLALYHAKRSGRDRSVQILPGGRIVDTAPEEMQAMLADLDASVRNGFFSIEEQI